VSYPEIRFEREGHIATITFDRPEALNALTLKSLESACRALDEAKSDPEIRVVVLTGSGRAFCAGADVKRMQADHAEGASLEPLQRLGHRIVLQIVEMPKPVIGMINGVAAGGGLAIALACDLRVMAESAYLKEAALSIGITPGDGAAWFLPRLVGLGRAFEIMCLEPKVSARQAESLGLANRVVADADLASAVSELAAKLAAKAPLALTLTKRSIQDGLSLDLPDLLENLVGILDLTRRTNDHREGISAFAERRTPEFRGN
jgi:enoyl-CoA hydratase/carnithine racemase